MLPDFEMIQHQFYGGHDIKIIPIADVHLGSPECKEQEFIKFIDKIAQEENTYLILAGDLIDNGTRSSVTDPFKATMPPSQQKREMANILEKVKGKILCFVPGNHERRSRKDADDDPVYDIAAKLDLEHLYRENIAMLEKIDGLAGTTPWILKDFRSPRRVLNGIQDYYNRKGLFSDQGEKKKAFYVLRDWYEKKMKE